MKDDAAAMSAELALLKEEVGKLRDAEAVRRLHFTYGYCMDKWLFDDIVDLYADDCRLHFMNGVWEGKAGARRLYNWTNGLCGPQDGLLAEHILAQDVI